MIGCVFIAYKSEKKSIWMHRVVIIVSSLRLKAETVLFFCFWREKPCKTPRWSCNTAVNLYRFFMWYRYVLIFFSLSAHRTCGRVSLCFIVCAVWRFRFVNKEYKWNRLTASSRRNSSSLGRHGGDAPQASWLENFIKKRSPVLLSAMARLLTGSNPMEHH